MDRLVKSIRFEPFGHGFIILVCFAMCAVVLLQYVPDFLSLATAYSQRSMMIKHDIQTEEVVNSCMYSISILVLDKATNGVLSDSLIEFSIGQNVIKNKTDYSGTTEISFKLDEATGGTCMEILLSEGYTIRASRAGYSELGIGAVS